MNIFDKVLEYDSVFKALKEAHLYKEKIGKRAFAEELKASGRMKEFIDRFASAICYDADMEARIIHNRPDHRLPESYRDWETLTEDEKKFYHWKKTLDNKDQNQSA